MRRSLGSSRRAAPRVPLRAHAATIRPPAGQGGPELLQHLPLPAPRCLTTGSRTMRAAPPMRALTLVCPLRSVPSPHGVQSRQGDRLAAPEPGAGYLCSGLRGRHEVISPSVRASVWACGPILPHLSPGRGCATATVQLSLTIGAVAASKAQHIVAGSLDDVRSCVCVAVVPLLMCASAVQLAVEAKQKLEQERLQRKAKSPTAGDANVPPTRTCVRVRTCPVCTRAVQRRSSPLCVRPSHCPRLRGGSAHCLPAATVLAWRAVWCFRVEGEWPVVALRPAGDRLVFLLCCLPQHGPLAAVGVPWRSAVRERA